MPGRSVTRPRRSLALAELSYPGYNGRWFTTRLAGGLRQKAALVVAACRWTALVLAGKQ